MHGKYNIFINVNFICIIFILFESNIYVYTPWHLYDTYNFYIQYIILLFYVKL
jgi:hypothetical protein